MEKPIYVRLYPIREQTFLKIDHYIKSYIDATIQGSGKTIASLRLAGKYNKTTIVFVDNHRKGMEVYDEWKTYNNAMISYMLSRTRPCNIRMQKAISEILGIDFKDKYICNECNTDEQILTLYNKRYIEKEHCWNCPSNSVCVYFGLKEHSLKKRQFKENRLIILVKSYIHTPYFKELINTHDNFGLIIDEGFLEIMTKDVVFSRSFISNKMYIDWIKMVDWIVEQVNDPERNLTIFWKDIKELLLTIINYDLSAKEREKQIGDNLIKLFDDYSSIDDFEEWNNLLKFEVYFYYRDRLESIVTNQFYDIQMIFEDIYDHLDPDEIRDRIFINEQNGEFTYIIKKKEEISLNINISKNTIIPASNLDKELFKELLPDHENKFVYLRGEDKSKFKQVNQIRNFKYAKSTIYNPIIRKDKETGLILDKYSVSFYILLNMTKTILKIEKDKKILIIAQRDITKRIKQKLRADLIRRSIETNNCISVEYYYNVEGINLYQIYDVIILFGSAGIPHKKMKILSRILGVSISKLEDYYTNQQHLQCIERLRSVIYPYKKVGYVLTNVDLPVPKEQIIKFNNINEIKFLEKLKEIGASKESECLEIYNNTIENPLKQQQMNNVLRRMIKDDILERYKQKSGKRGQPSWYYIVPI